MKEMTISSSKSKDDPSDDVKTINSSILFKWIKSHLKCVKPFWLVSNNTNSNTNIFTFFSKHKDQRKTQQKLKMEVLLNNIDKKTKQALYEYLQNLNLKVEEKERSKNNESTCEVNVSSIVNNNDAFKGLLKYFKDLDNNDQHSDRMASELHIENKFNNPKNNFKMCNNDRVRDNIKTEIKTDTFQNCREYSPYDLGNTCNNYCEERNTYVKLQGLCSEDFNKQTKLFFDSKAQVYSDHEVCNRKFRGGNKNSDIEKYPISVENCRNEYQHSGELLSGEKTMVNLCLNNSVNDNKSKVLKKETFSNEKKDLGSNNYKIVQNCFFNKAEYFVPKFEPKCEELSFEKYKEVINQQKACNNYSVLGEHLYDSKCAGHVNRNMNVKINCPDQSEKQSFSKSLTYKIKDLDLIKLCTENNSDQNSHSKLYTNKMMSNAYKLRVLPILSKGTFSPYNKSLHSRTDSKSVVNDKIFSFKNTSSKKVRFSENVSVQYSDKHRTVYTSSNAPVTNECHIWNSCGRYSRNLHIEGVKHERNTPNFESKCSPKEDKRTRLLQEQNVVCSRMDTSSDRVQHIINSDSSSQSKFNKEITLTMDCKNAPRLKKDKALITNCENSNICLNELDIIAYSIKKSEVPAHQRVENDQKRSMLNLNRKYANTSIDFKCNTYTHDGSTQTPSFVAPTVCSKKCSKFTVHKHVSSSFRSSSGEKARISNHQSVTNKPYKLYSDNDVELILLRRDDGLSKSECKKKNDFVQTPECKSSILGSRNRTQGEKRFKSDKTFLNTDSMEWEDTLCPVGVEPCETVSEHKAFVSPTEKIQDVCDKLESSLLLQSPRCNVLHEDGETQSLTKPVNSVVLNNSALLSGTEISQSSPKYFNKEHQVDKVSRLNSDKLNCVNKKSMSSDILTHVSSTKTVNECVNGRSHLKLPVTAYLEQSMNKSDNTGDALIKVMLKNRKGKLEVTERNISIEDCIKQIYSNLRKENKDVNSEISELIKLKVVDSLSEEILTQCRALISMKDVLFYCLLEVDSTDEDTSHKPSVLMSDYSKDII